MAVVSSSKMNFKEVFEEIMLHYCADVQAVTAEVVPEVAKEAAKKLRSTSPKGRTGRYAKSWAVKQEKGRMQVLATVYAKAPGYRQAHLLEHGHAKRGGGRVSAIEHIKPVEEWAINEAEDRIIEGLERKWR